MYTQEQERKQGTAWPLNPKALVLEHVIPSRRVFCSMRILFSSVLTILLALPLSSATFVVPSPSPFHVPSLTSRAAGNSSLLECLQVAAPVSSSNGCQQTLMVHTFAWSYGQPFKGE